MDYTIKTELFDYDGGKRKRPIRVAGYVPTTPNYAPKREEVMPLALFKKKSSWPDVPCHNTVRGHLIGLDSLGGEELPENLVPMYGQFNLSTYKTKFENVLKSKVQRTSVTSGELDLRIEYGDGKSDPRIPVAFSFTLEIKYKDGRDDETVKDRIPHPAPEPAYVELSSKFIKYVDATQKKMERASWFLEDHVVCYARAKLNPEHGKKPIVPPRDYSARPYALIDFALFALEDTTWFDHRAAPEIYNGGGFNQQQIDEILAVNAAKNGGYYKSDDPNDYVYGGKGALFKYTDTADQYYLHAHACANNQDGVLIMSGYHQKPEIDHIVNKGKHINPGCNACSNARVISRYLNSEDRGKYAL